MRLTTTYPLRSQIRYVCVCHKMCGVQAGVIEVCLLAFIIHHHHWKQAAPVWALACQMLLQTVVKFKLSGSLLLHYCSRVFFLFVEVKQLQVLQPNFVSILKILFLLMTTGNPSTSQFVESSVFRNSFICMRNNRELSLYKYWQTQQLNSTLNHFIIDI